MSAITLQTHARTVLKGMAAYWKWGLETTKPYMLGAVIGMSYIPFAWVAYKNTLLPGSIDFSDVMIGGMYGLFGLGLISVYGFRGAFAFLLYMVASKDAASFMLFASMRERAAVVLAFCFFVGFYPQLKSGALFVFSKSYRQQEMLRILLRKFARPRRIVLRTYFKKWYPSLHGLTRGEIYATRTHLVFELHRITKHPDVKLDSIELSQRMATHVTVEEIQKGKRRIVKVMTPHGTKADHVLAEGEELDLSW